MPHAAHVSGLDCQANNDTLLRSPLFKVPVPSLRAKPQRPKSRIGLSSTLASSTIFKGKRHWVVPPPAPPTPLFRAKRSPSYSRKPRRTGCWSWNGTDAVALRASNAPPTCAHIRLNPDMPTDSRPLGSEPTALLSDHLIPEGRKGRAPSALPCTGRLCQPRHSQVPKS